MQRYSIITGTITYAIKGRDILRRFGYEAYIEKITSSSRNIGCGYSIVISGDVINAEKILRNSGIKILQIDKK